jgi:hypothetical protein
MNTMRRLWNGELSLPVAFWIGGVAVLIVVVFVLPTFLLALGTVAATEFLVISVGIAIVAAAYQVLATVGTWRSARRYAGPRAWAVLARVFSLLSLALLVAQLALVIQMASVDTADSARSSANAAGTLKADPAFPFTGFWKTDCAQNFGLVVEPSGKANTYAVSFCGPGGCFRPGTYRPDTTILNDPSYKVVDDDTIDVLSKDGFTRYARCTRLAPPMKAHP